MEPTLVTLNRFSTGDHEMKRRTRSIGDAIHEYVSAGAGEKRWKRAILTGTATCLLALTACAGQQASIVGYDPDEVGRDEFAILTNPPLTLPPDFSLRPPRQSSILANDERARQQAEAILLGKSEEGRRREERGELLRSNLPEDDLAFLTEAKALSPDANIRAELDEELTQLVDPGEEFLDRVLFWRSDEDEEEEKEYLLPGEVPRILTNE